MVFSVSGNGLQWGTRHLPIPPFVFFVKPAPYHYVIVGVTVASSDFKLLDDFSYLIMMTDGIYDPKFVVEINLEKIEKWKGFIDDLQGKNDDGVKVEFNASNPEIAKQLSAWMDFWSAGNHDDRTLAVVF